MDAVIALVTLTLMEVVLGIDNIVFLSILVGNLPSEQQKKARFIGLSLAVVARIALLLGIKWVMGLNQALFHWTWIGWIPDGWAAHHEADAVTGKDIVLLLGGAFLVGKSVVEIHKKATHEDELESPKARATLRGVLVQIVIIDLVFSLDSVISAVGMARDLWVMIVAMLVAVLFMAVFAGKVASFIDRNPTFKLLALSFLVLIGVMLFAEGAGTPINKGYIYAAVVFALVVEMINMRIRKRERDRAAQAST
jgi:predicted tellurium resistance membrane protein TerC